MRIIRVVAEVDVQPCVCGRTPRAEMRSRGGGVAITCDHCRLSIVEAGDMPEALEAAGRRWNETIKEEAPEPATEKLSVAVGGANVSQGVTAGETATDSLRGEVELGAETPQGRGGALDEEDLRAAVDEPDSPSSTPTSTAAVPGRAGRPDQPGQRLDPVVLRHRTDCRCGRQPRLEVLPAGDIYRAVLSCTCGHVLDVTRLGLCIQDAVTSAVAYWNARRERESLMKITLGQVVRDVITGFEGVVTGRVEYLTGCSQVLVQPRVDATGKMVDSAWMDESRMEIVTAEPLRIDVQAGNAGPDKPAPRC